jgi:hypothetical protein
MLERKQIIANMIELANKLDNDNYFEEAEELTKIAQFMGDDRTPTDHIPPREDDKIINKSIDMMLDMYPNNIPEGISADEWGTMIENKDIPDDVWAEAEQKTVNDETNKEEEWNPDMDLDLPSPIDSSLSDVTWKNHGFNWRNHSPDGLL